MFQSEEGLPSAAPKAPAPACVEEAEPKSPGSDGPGHKAAEGKDAPEAKAKPVNKDVPAEEGTEVGKKGDLGEPKAIVVSEEGQQEGMGAVTVAQLLEKRRKAVMDAVDKEVRLYNIFRGGCM